MSQEASEILIPIDVSKTDSHVQNGIVKGIDNVTPHLNGQTNAVSNGHNASPVETITDHVDGSDSAQNISDRGRAPLLSQGSSYKSEETPTNADTTILSVIQEKEKVPTRDKKPSDGDSADYDTQSDSIETLEEENSRDDTSNDLSDSLVRQITLTNPSEDAPDEDDILMADPIVDPDDDLGSIGALRPESLSLPRPLQQVERQRSRSEVHVKNIKDDIRSQLERARTQSEVIDIVSSRKPINDLDTDNYLSKSLPHGTIMRKGEMIEFVAEDLQEKIRRSSPLSRTDSSCYSSRRSSLRSVSSSTSASTSMATSTASGMSRSPSSLFQQSPDDIPPIDPQVILDLENQAHLVADSMDLMMGNLKANLHKMSSITVGCLDAYRRSVDFTCESVDGSIKAMYALMAKCEELSTNMQPIYKLAEKIKEIKRLLDLFEAQLSDNT